MQVLFLNLKTYWQAMQSSVKLRILSRKPFPVFLPKMLVGDISPHPGDHRLRRWLRVPLER